MSAAEGWKEGGSNVEQRAARRPVDRWVRPGSTAEGLEGWVSDATPSLNFSTAAFRADPYPTYHLLRSSQPIFESSQYDRTWVLSRFADCEEVLRDQRWSGATDMRRHLPDGSVATPRRVGVRGMRPLNLMDPPEHTRVRRLMARVFTPRAVESLRPRMQQLVDEILDAAAGRGELDVIADLGDVVPMMVICEILALSSRPRRTATDSAPMSCG